MSDLISRQDAIDAIDTLLIQLHERHTNGVKGSFEDGVQDGYCRIRSSIKWMPSAQSEIIHCKDCIWHLKDDSCARLYCITDDDFYCWHGRREE